LNFLIIPVVRLLRLRFYKAFDSAGYKLTNASVRGRLNSLTYEGKIRRVGFGIYSGWSSQLFNLIISGREGAWGSGNINLERSRFLEYTDSKIAQFFKPLDQTVLPRLISLPTLFAYEKGVKGSARVGRIKDIHLSSREISIWFELDEGWPEIPAQVFSEVKRIFDVERSEEHRTHWSIKELNLYDQLEKIGVLRVEPVIDFVPDIPEVRPAAIEPIWREGKLILEDAFASPDLELDTLTAAMRQSV
jgi:hypothetical protein